MTILLIAGTASKDIRNKYIHAITEKLARCIYLNIDNLLNVFSERTPTQEMEKYSRAQRIDHPSHEILINLAHNNLSLNKIVLLDGRIDYSLIADLIQKNSNFAPKKADIKAIYLHSLADEMASVTAELEKLTSNNILKLNVTQDFSINIADIYQFMKIDFLQENKPENKKLLIMSAGLAGVGKTTHLRPVCNKIANSIYLDTDIVTYPFLNGVNQPLNGDYYNRHIKDQRYEVMFRFALDNVSLNKIPILDGCFGDKLSSDRVKSLIAIPDLITTAIYFHCSLAMQESRVRDRNEKRDAEKLKDMVSDRHNNLQKHMTEFAKVSNIFCIDTENKENLDKNIARIFDHIRSKNLKSLAINALDTRTCKIDKEEAKCGFEEFQMLVSSAKNKTRQLSSILPAKDISIDKNSKIFEKSKAVEMEGFGLKLFSGTSYLRPYYSFGEGANKRFSR